MNPLNPFVAPNKPKSNPFAAPTKSSVQQKPYFPGIHILDKKIEFISGPVAMYYLKPPTPRKGEVDLPLIILFSDYHESISNECQFRRNTYSIYGKEFLQLLDQLASDIPIDFFLESSIYSKTSLSNPGILFQKMYKSIRHCGPKGVHLPDDEEKESACPTQNIRWHDADVRLMKEKGEEFTMFTIMSLKLSYISNSLSLGHFDIFDNPDTLYKNKELFTGLSDLEELLLLVDIAFLKRIIDIIFSENDIDYIIKELSKLQGEWFYNDFRKSLVYKQYKKSKISEWLPLSRVYEIISTVWTRDQHLRALLCLKNQKSKEFIWFRDNIYRIIDPEGIFGQPDPIDKNSDTNLIITYFKTLIEIFKVINAINPDLYTLFRMFKTPSGNFPGSLCIGFFGDRHVQMMRSILTSDPFNYQISYKIPVKTFDNKPIVKFDDQSNFIVKRCLEIDQDIYLERDVREHNSKQIIARSIPSLAFSVKQKRKSKRKSIRKSKRKSIRKNKKKSIRKNKKKSIRKSKRKSIRKSKNKKKTIKG